MMLPLIPALAGRGRRGRGFEASMVYIERPLFQNKKGETLEMPSYVFSLPTVY